MKKLFYSLCGLIFLLPASLLAEDTFYVNSSGGNNANAGTQESPWRDLNPSRWTDNCTVIVQGEIYVDPEIDVSAGETLKKITIRGANESAALMGLDDDLYADPEEWNISRMFVVNECELTLRNITLKNMKRDGARDEGIPGAGGMIFVGPYGTLNMENVIVKNSVLKNREMWGGAINSEGTLNIRNSVFENCAAYQGGVFYIQNTEAQAVAVFEGCTFKNNTTHAGIPLPYPGGGVFWIQGNNLNISFDKCYFESNVCTNTSAWAGEPRGGAIRMQGMGGNVTFSMKNSVAANNKSEGEGAFAQISKASGNLNFSFINNVFYKNAVTNPAFPNGQCIGFSGQAADHDMTGSSLVFVNNTSLFNQIPGQANQASYYSTSWNKADAIIFANNLFLDRIEPEGEAEVRVGYGFVFEEWDTEHQSGSYIVRNNITDGTGGSGGMPFLSELGKSENSNLQIDNAQSTADILEFIGIKNDLTFPADGKHPYVEIEKEAGIAVNGGVNTLLFNGNNLVLQTDIRGYGIAGDSRDIGSFEYNGIPPTGISRINVSQVFAYPNPVTDILYFRKPVAKAGLYNPEGKICLLAKQVSSLNVSQLRRGLYILQTVDLEGNIHTQKIQKQ